MISTTLHTLEEESVPVFITEDSRRIAQGFAKQQSHPEKADQVYRNTLAISVVNNYLRVLGLATDLTHCDSWNPMMRMMVNTADLEIVGRGRLECRPLSTEDLQSPSPTCHIPTDVQDDRIGYIVVHLDENEATLLGFAPTVETEYLPLSQLQPLSDLLPHLHAVDLATEVSETLTTLSQWLQNTVESGWQTLDSLLGTPAVQYRQVAKTASVSRQMGKVLESDIQEDHPLLMVKITAPDQATAATLADSTVSPAEMDIQVKVQPSPGQANLPQGLRLQLVDETGVTVMDAVNTEERRVVQLDFQAETGDRFDIHIQWAETSFTERFVV